MSGERAADICNAAARSSEHIVARCVACFVHVVTANLCFAMRRRSAQDEKHCVSMGAQDIIDTIRARHGYSGGHASNAACAENFETSTLSGSSTLMRPDVLTVQSEQLILFSFVLWVVFLGSGTALTVVDASKAAVGAAPLTHGWSWRFLIQLVPGLTLSIMPMLRTLVMRPRDPLRRAISPVLALPAWMLLCTLIITLSMILDVAGVDAIYISAWFGTLPVLVLYMGFVHLRRLSVSGEMLHHGHSEW